MRSNLQRALQSIMLVGLGGAIAGVALGADDPGTPPATPPATQPVYVPQPSPNGPGASPAPAAGPSRTAATSIVMIPFAEIGADTQMEWVGRGIQQDLGADVARGSRLIVVTPTGASPATDPDAALKAARDVHAGLAVFGHFQVVGSDLRVTGQLLDVRSGQALAVLKATDNKQNLFHIEDLLAQQIIAGLPQEMLTKANGSSGYPTTENPQYAPPADGGQNVPASGSGQYAQTQVPNYVPAPDNYQPSYDYQPQYEYPDTGYDYGPYYSGYGYPYFDGFAVYGGYGRYHNGWHHGDGHDGHDYHGANVYNGGYVGGSPRSNIGGGARPSASSGAHVGGGGGAHVGGGGGGAHVGGGGGGGGHAGGGGGHR